MVEEAGDNPSARHQQVDAGVVVMALVRKVLVVNRLVDYDLVEEGEATNAEGFSHVPVLAAAAFERGVRLSRVRFRPLDPGHGPSPVQARVESTTFV